jgi:hypothetical protein
MKNMQLGISTAIVIFLLGMASAVVFLNPGNSSNLATNTANAQTVVAVSPAQWEYSSVSIDVVSLQPKLTAMGVDGWEVISIAPIDSVVDTGNDGKMHVTATRFEVTAKRKRR